MRQYELVVILPLEEEAGRLALEKLQADLESARCVIESRTEMGERDLAYEIAGVRRAKYLLLDLKAPPSALSHLDKVMKLNSGLIRYLFSAKR